MRENVTKPLHFGLLDFAFAGTQCNFFLLEGFKDSLKVTAMVLFCSMNNDIVYDVHSILAVLDCLPDSFLYLTACWTHNHHHSFVVIENPWHTKCIESASIFFYLKLVVAVGHTKS